MIRDRVLLKVGTEVVGVSPKVFTAMYRTTKNITESSSSYIYKEQQPTSNVTTFDTKGTNSDCPFCEGAYSTDDELLDHILEGKCVTSCNGMS